MDKGISTVIATLLMLIITIALVGFSYSFITSFVGSKTGGTFSVVDTYKDSLTISNDGTDIISSFTSAKVDDANAVYRILKQDTALIGHWNMDEGKGTSVNDASGKQNSGSLSGTVIADFEDSLDNFGLDCGGLPTTAFVSGKIGKALKLWSTGDSTISDGLACATKSTPGSTGYTIFFYGKGYVGAQIYDTTGASYIEDVETGCKTTDGGVRIFDTCNNGNPYPDWKLFKVVAFRDTPSGILHIYNNNVIGESNAGYYDFITDGPVWYNAKFGNGLQFDGRNDYIEINNEPAFDISKEHTLMAWIKVKQTSDDQLIVGKEDSYILNVFGTNRGDNVGKVEFWSPSTTPNAIISDATVDDNNWHHIAGVYDGTNRKIYIDGILDKTLSTTGNLGQNDAPLRIGTWCNETCRFVNGILEEVKVYNRALSEQEIKTEFNSGSQVNAGELATVKIYNNLSPGNHKVRLCTASACNTAIISTS